MSTPDPKMLREAAAQFSVKRPTRFENLHPWKEVIEELREKRASYHTIADFLHQYGIQTSKTTLADFCKVVLHEPPKRKRRDKRAKATPTAPTSPARPPQGADGLTLIQRQAQPATPPHPPDGSGPTQRPSPAQARPVVSGPAQGTLGTRPRGPRIANIELMED